jgi:rsbT antagonist protein RsbS
MLDTLDDDLEARLPIIWLWDCMLVPLQGELSDGQAARLTQDVLDGIRERGCEGLIIEVSGLWLVDSHLCASLADIARAARLMGTRTMLSGLRPEVALTLLAMDISFTGFETALNLEQALEALGIRRAADTRVTPDFLEDALHE